MHTPAPASAEAPREVAVGFAVACGGLAGVAMRLLPDTVPAVAQAFCSLPLTACTLARFVGLPVAAGVDASAEGFRLRALWCAEYSVDVERLT